MPIIPINSPTEFDNLFPTRFEYVCIIGYSPLMEKISDTDPEKMYRYLDRLSNSDKWSHVLFAEFNMDKLQLDDQLFVTAWPNCWLYRGDSMKRIARMTFRQTYMVRNLLEHAK